MLEFLFGKKKKRSVKTVKPPANVLRMAKKYKVKVTLKRGSKKVYRPLRVIKRQIMINKKKKSRFGSSAAVFHHDPDFGYSRSANQAPGITSYTSSVVPSQSVNIGRPERQRYGAEYGSTQIAKKYIPVYGTGKPFFNSTVPTSLPPNWFGARQSDGSLSMYGSPFSGYTRPSMFGKKRKTSKKNVKPPAKILKMCKKLKIKVTIKRGSKRVYKSLSVLKKQIKKAMKKH